MKSKAKISNIKFCNLSFYIIIFFSILFYSINSLSIGQYPYMKKLNNGRYIVISSTGITFLDENLINESNTVLFNHMIYNQEFSFLSTNIEQFPKEDNEYIIVFFKDDQIGYFSLYLFSSNETLLYRTETIPLIENAYTMSSQLTQYFSIVPYHHSENKYYFYIIYNIYLNIDYVDLKFIKGTFDSSSNSAEFIEPQFLTFNIYLYDYDQSLSCKLMKSMNNETINCIFIGYNNYLDFLMISPNENIDYFERGFIYLDPLDNKFFKALVLPEKEEVILCSSYINTFNCFQYNTITDDFINFYTIELNNYFYTLYSQNSIIVEYFNETKEILIGFINVENSRIYISKCTEDLNCTNIKENILPEQYNCNFFNPNIIKLLNEKNYYYAFLCDLNENPIELFLLNFNSFSFDSNSLNTYINCDLNNIKCGICTEESIQKNLCITCNKEENFYPKIDEEIRNDGLINCYENLEGYYLKNDILYPCYSTCKSCVEEGNEYDNKCKECKDGYEFKNDTKNTSNCYQICQYYYFYDSNNIYNCAPDYICPENYKLISSKGKCIDDCINDNIYLYEYNNVCYENCPEGTISNDDMYKCEEELNCIDKYYNYNHTECIDEIPDGYYCDNTELKTIDKCHNNCETCKKGPTDNNNNCLKCKDSLYLDLGNCVDTCTNGSLTKDGSNICKCSYDIKCKICSEESKEINQCISCNIEEGYYPKFNDTNNIYPFFNCYNNETIFDRYYLNKTLYSFEPCYNTCSKCSSYGDKINNNCDECKIGYYFTSKTNNDKNCYQCNNYYYFDSSNNYHCTEGNYCPESYNKLISAKRRCIDNCNKDNTYIYEYQNECYSSCPSNTGPNENNICIFKQNELELVCPEEYPYEMVYEKKCVQQCNITLFLNNICKINNPKAKESGVNIIKESIKNGSIDDILTNIKENGEDLIINEKDIKYQITTTDNQKNNQNNNISTIYLGECENILKEKYNISSKDSLLIFKIDVKVEGLSSSVVEYEVYHPITKKPLNLSYCQNTSIQIQVPVIINEDEVYKYDPSSDYYNDICFPTTSENGTDIILSDRQNEFVNNNLSLCQDGCTFSGYDTNTKKAKCECDVKTQISDLTNIKIDKDKLLDSFLDIKSLVNINIMKCFKLLFSKDGF